MVRISYVFFMPILVLLLNGCDNSGKPKLVEAKGSLTYKGTPLKQCSVRFVPTAGGASSSGVTDANGEFVLTSEDGRPGIAPGSYRVIIIDVSSQAYLDDPLNPNPQPAQPKVSNPPLPAEWSGQQSPITVDVKARVPIKLEL